MDTEPGTMTTVALVVVVLALAVVLAWAVGLWPGHEPGVPTAPTTTSIVAPCGTHTPVTAGVCVLPNGHELIIP